MRDDTADRLDHAFDIQENVVVPESQDDPALRLKLAGTKPINLAVVLLTIQFNDQIAFDATEIGDIGRDWVLSTNLQTFNLSSPQALPEFAFGVRGGMAHAARVLAGCRG